MEIQTRLPSNRKTRLILYIDRIAQTFEHGKYVYVDQFIHNSIPLFIHVRIARGGAPRELSKASQFLHTIACICDSQMSSKYSSGASGVLPVYT